MENSNSKNTRTIVVGVDGSPESEAALEWAIQHECRPGDSIQVVTVHPKSQLLPGTSLALQPHGRIPRQENLYSPAASVAALTRHFPDRTVIMSSTEGDAATELVSASMNADLLVIGSRKNGPLGELILGSVSHECVRRSLCPVVLITSNVAERFRAKTNSSGTINANVSGE